MKILLLFLFIPYWLTFFLFGFELIFLNKVVQGFVNVFELPVIFAFHFLEFIRQIFMRKGILPQKDKSPHNSNVYFYGFLLFNTLESIDTPCSVKANGRAGLNFTVSGSLSQFGI